MLVLLKSLHEIPRILFGGGLVPQADQCVDSMLSTYA